MLENPTNNAHMMPECTGDAEHVVLLVHVNPEKAGTGEMGGMWRRW